MDETFLSLEDRKLLKAALEAMEKAYVLWGFRVGAAVLAEDNQVYEGCNIESRISGLGVCAERCAINHAVLHGNRRILKVALVIEDDNVFNAMPCGVCRQYIYDFSDGKALILSAKAKNGEIIWETVKVSCISELLPDPFSSKKYQGNFVR